MSRINLEKVIRYSFVEIIQNIRLSEYQMEISDIRVSD